MNDHPHEEKDYIIASFTTSDLLYLGFTEEEVDNLTDEELEAIARRASDVYHDQSSYWSDLEFATQRVLEEKQEHHDHSS